MLFKRSLTVAKNYKLLFKRSPTVAKKFKLFERSPTVAKNYKLPFQKLITVSFWKLPNSWKIISFDPNASWLVLENVRRNKNPFRIKIPNLPTSFWWNIRWDVLDSFKYHWRLGSGESVSSSSLVTTFKLARPHSST